MHLISQFNYLQVLRHGSFIAKSMNEICITNHHLAHMEFTHSNLHLEVSLMVSSGFFCLLVCIFLLFSVIYYRAVCLYVATCFFYIPVFCPKLGLYLVLLQSLCLFYNLFKCILLFFSYISSLLLLFFLHLSL